MIYCKKNVVIDNVNMLYYDKIDNSGGIDINKAIASSECDVCHYWYFLDKRFKVAT